jgi:metal transporter CNNM
MKHFVPEKPWVRSKTSDTTHDDKEWKAAILKHVNLEELPACYSGTRTYPDGNPNCTTLASPYLLLGSSFSFKSLENEDQYGRESSYNLRYKTDSTNKKSLSIPKDSKEQLEFQVKEAGAMLKYCIIPYKRLKSHLYFFPI